MMVGVKNEENLHPLERIARISINSLIALVVLYGVWDLGKEYVKSQSLLMAAMATSQTEIINKLLDEKTPE